MPDILHHLTKRLKERDGRQPTAVELGGILAEALKSCFALGVPELSTASTGFKP